MLALFDRDGNLQDRYNIRRLRRDVSLGRIEGENALFYFDAPSPNTANTSPLSGIVAVPHADVTAGCYETAQQVALACDTPDAKIYYTTDGTTPTQASKPYSGPITVSRTGMVRAAAFREGYLSSATYTASFIINDAHTLPVVSLVADPADLYSEEKGIFVTGPDASAEYPYTGANFWQDWEVPAHIEIMENGQAVFGQDVGLKVFGAYSRAIDQKGLAIFARSEYGESTIDYPLFEDRPFAEYKSVVLRSGGQDGPLTKIRDILQTSLAAEHTDLDVMAYKTCILYINGEYRGVYHMREKTNKYYIAQHCDLPDPDDIDLLEGNGTAAVGNNEDYQALIAYMKDHSLADKESFEYVAARMDVDNYMDYAIMQIFFNNTDLGNIKFWRSHERGAKWRWILFDLDWGMYLLTRDNVAAFLDPEGMGVNKFYSTEIFRSLMENAAWKHSFLERFAYLLSTSFSAEHVLQKIDEITATIIDELPREKEMYGRTMNNYELHMVRLRSFAENRPEIVVYQLRDNLGLTKEETIDLFGTAGRAPTAQEIENDY